MQAADQTESLRNPQAENEEKGNQKARKPSGDPFFRPWRDWEIRAFLHEWEVVEYEVGFPGGKIYEKSRAISKRLYQKGIKKNYKRCFHMLISLQDLYWAVHEANEKPRSEPLFCPYGEALYRVLECSTEAGPLSDADLSSMYPQPPEFLQPLAYLPTPVYWPQDSGIPVPSGEVQWVPSPVAMVQDPLASQWPQPPEFLQFSEYLPTPVYGIVQDPLSCQWQPWNMSPLWEVPQLLPAMVPGVPSLQQSCSISYDHPDPQ